MEKNGSSEDRSLDFFESCPETAIVPRPGALLSLQSLATYESTAKMLVVCGAQSSSRSGFRKKFDLVMDDLDCDIVFHDAVEPEFDVGNLARLKDFMEEFGPDMVVAAGGGSVMDAAKAAYMWHQAGGSIDDYFGKNRFSGANPGRRLRRVVCVPTTAGTGSEVTPYSNVVDRRAGVKKLIAEKEIVPSHALLDPSLCFSCGRDLTLQTALDALCHSIEGFLQPSSEDDQESDEWALEAVGMIVSGLPDALVKPDLEEARTLLSYAATLGGMVISTKPTGIPHLLSYPFYGKIAHGLAVAILLPSAWSYYCGNREVADKTMRLARFFGGGKSPDDVVAGYRSFITRCGAPSGMSAAGLDDSDLDRSVALASENRMKLEKLPRKMADEEVDAVLRDIIHLSK